MSRWRAVGVYLGVREPPECLEVAPRSRRNRVLDEVYLFVGAAVLYSAVTWATQRHLGDAILEGVAFAAVMSGWSALLRRQRRRRDRTR